MTVEMAGKELMKAVGKEKWEMNAPRIQTASLIIHVTLMLRNVGINNASFLTRTAQIISSVCGVLANRRTTSGNQDARKLLTVEVMDLNVKMGRCAI